MIIILTGRMGSGKDTVCDFVTKHYGAIKITLAKPIKNVGSMLFDWDDEHSNGSLKEKEDIRYGFSPREFYQWFGTDVMQKALRKRFPNWKHGNLIWTNIAISEIDSIQTFAPDNENFLFVVNDCRFPHEVDAFRRHFGPDSVLVVKIERTRLSWWKKLCLHKSEKMLDKITPDVIVYNKKDVATLFQKVETVLNHFGVPKENT
jgi:hypothetical protein